MKSREKKKGDPKAREDRPGLKVLGEGPRQRGRFLLFPPILLAILASMLSCDLLNIDGADAKSGEVLLVSYNVQNLFDAVSDGGEYPDFDPDSSSWSERSFHAKLSHIADVLNAIIEKEDFICILQEIENRNALCALAEKIDSDGEKLFLYISNHSGSATHVAVLSNLKAVSLRGHSYAGTEKRPRLILELEFDVKGEKLIVFGNHWKSKYGGAEETEAERRAAAGILKQRIVTLLREEPVGDIIVMGDLNEEPDEYEKNGSAYQTALMPYPNPGSIRRGDAPRAIARSAAPRTSQCEAAHTTEQTAPGAAWAASPGAARTILREAAPGAAANTRSSVRGAARGSAAKSAALGNEAAYLLLTTSREDAGWVGEDLVLYSTWAEADEEGTYYYQGTWERIDHALLCPGLFDDRGLSYVSFRVFTDDFFLDSQGRPLACNRGEADGYSDHLPILVRLKKP